MTARIGHNPQKRIENRATFPHGAKAETLKKPDAEDSKRVASTNEAPDLDQVMADEPTAVDRTAAIDSGARPTGIKPGDANAANMNLAAVPGESRELGGFGTPVRPVAATANDVDVSDAAGDGATPTTDAGSPTLDEDVVDAVAIGAEPETDADGNTVTDHKLYDKDGNLRVQKVVKPNADGINVDKTIAYDRDTQNRTEMNLSYTTADGQDIARTIHYDASGKAHSSVTRATSVDDEGNATEKVRHHRYGEDGKPVLVDGPIPPPDRPDLGSGATTLDGDLYDADGKKRVSVQRETTEDGNARHSTTVFDPGTGNESSRVDRGIDDAGNPETIRTTNDANGDMTRRRTEGADENGEPIATTQFYDEGRLDSIETETTDAEGNLDTAGEQYDADGNVVGRSRQFTNKNGTQIDQQVQLDPETGLRTKMARRYVTDKGDNVTSDFSFDEEGKISGSTQRIKSAPDEDGFYQQTVRTRDADGKILEETKKEERDLQVATENRMTAKVEELLQEQDNIEIQESAEIETGRRRVKKNDDWEMESYEFVEMGGRQHRLRFNDDGTARVDGKDYPIRMSEDGKPILVTKHQEVDVAAKINEQLSGEGDPDGPTFETLQAEVQEELAFEELQRKGATDLSTEEFEALSAADRKAIVNEAALKTAKTGKGLTMDEFRALPPDARQAILDDDDAREKVVQNFTDGVTGRRSFDVDPQALTAQGGQPIDPVAEEKKLMEERQQRRYGRTPNGTEYMVVGNPSQQFIDQTIQQFEKAHSATLHEDVDLLVMAPTAGHIYPDWAGPKSGRGIGGYWQDGTLMMAEGFYADGLDANGNLITSKFTNDSVDRAGTIAHELAHAAHDDEDFGLFAGEEQFTKEFDKTIDDDFANLDPAAKRALRQGTTYRDMAVGVDPNAPIDAQMKEALKHEIIAEAAQSLMGYPGDYGNIRGPNGESLEEMFPGIKSKVQERFIANGINPVEATPELKDKIAEVKRAETIDPNTGRPTGHFTVTMDQIRDPDFMTALAYMDNLAGGPVDGIGAKAFTNIRVSVPDAHVPQFRPDDIGDERDWIDKAGDWASNKVDKFVGAVVDDWNQKLAEQQDARGRGDPLAGSWDYNPKTGRMDYRAPGEKDPSQHWDPPTWMKDVIDWGRSKFGKTGRVGGDRRSDNGNDDNDGFQRNTDFDPNGRDERERGSHVSSRGGSGTQTL